MDKFTTFIETLLKDKNIFSIYTIFFIVSTLASMTFIPVSWVKITGGILLDFWPGFLITWFAVNIGGFMIFITCRTFGKDKIYQLLQRKLKSDNQISHHLDEIERKGLPLVINLQMIPLLPAWLVNILCGISSISIKHYIVGSLFGTLPGTIIAVNLASTIASDTKNPYSITLTIILFILFNLLVHIYSKKTDLIFFNKTNKFENDNT